MEPSIRNERRLPTDPTAGQSEAGRPVVQVRKVGTPREAGAPAASRTDRVVTVRRSREAVSAAPAEAPPTKDAGSSQDSSAGYYAFLGQIEEARPNNMSHHSTELYRKDLNLDEELADVPPGGLVIDVGCCGGVGTEGLAKRYTDKRFVGVTPTLILHREGNGTRELSIPIIRGHAEQLTETLQAHGYDQADVLLMRNVTQVICMGEDACLTNGTMLRDTMQQAHTVLKPGGKLLVYDHYGTGEQDIHSYARTASLGREAGFQVEQLPSTPTRDRNGHSSHYLRLTKSA